MGYISRSTKQFKLWNKITFNTKESQIVLNTNKYSSLRLLFQRENFNGHMGARRFWKEYLPTLQYYNPNFKIDVIRFENEDKRKQVPCILSVLNSQGESVVSIEMQNKHSEAIMQEFLDKVDFERVPEEQLVHYELNVDDPGIKA